MTKKRTTESLLAHMESLIIEEYDNEKTKQTLFGIIGTFRRFMTENGIEDNLKSLNMATMRQWRNWLVGDDLSISTAKSCFNYIFTLATKIERKYDYNFYLDKKRIEPLKDKRTLEEKQDNGIALTKEEIEQLENTLSEDSKLVNARDIFLLQCWCGCRVEDLPLLLSSKSLKKASDGTMFSEFTTQKTSTTVIVPLNTFYPRALEIVQKYQDKCPYNSTSERKKYNLELRNLAKLAGLDRKTTYTGQTGRKKYVKNRLLYEVISSHAGRHSFITNCIRYMGLKADEIKMMTGHADTSMIQKVYTNLTREDKMKAVINFSKQNNQKDDTKLHDKAIDSPNEFAQWLVKELGISPKGRYIFLTDLMDKIAEEKRRIVRKYGQDRYLQIKEYLGSDLGTIDKERLEKLFLHVWPHIPRPKIIGISKVNRTDFSKLWDLEEEVEF